MARKKCLDCPAVITSGSRCRDCARKYRSPYSRHQWAAAVKRRDGFRCVACGSGERLEAHHRIAKSDGGDDSLANGITLCGKCHDDHHAGRLRALPAPKVATGPISLDAYLEREAYDPDAMEGIELDQLLIGE